MGAVVRFFQYCSRIRWQRLADDQAFVISLVAGSAYLALGLLMLVAWARIRLVRTVFADDVYRHIGNRSKQPRRTKRPSSTPTTVAKHGWLHDLRRATGKAIQRSDAALRPIRLERFVSAEHQDDL